MTDFTWPASLRPNRVEYALRSNTGVTESPLNGAITTVGRAPANRWRMTWTFENLTRAKAGELMGVVAQLRGREHRLVTRTFVEPNLGSRVGLPVVNGNLAAGALVVSARGLAANQLAWLRRGDLISVGLELKVVIADVNTALDGTASINIEPKMRGTYPDGTTIEIVNPRGRFLLSTDDVSFGSQPGRWYSSALELVEAIV